MPDYLKPLCVYKRTPFLVYMFAKGFCAKAKMIKSDNAKSEFAKLKI